MKNTSTDESAVEFVCHPDVRGTIPEPQPASNVLPEWYKRLSTSLETDTAIFSTVRNCPAFLDALSLGWILPFEATIRVDNGASEWDDGDAGVVSKYTLGNGDLPDGISETVQFHSQWGIKLPDGYALLVMQPMNRREQRFKVIGQVLEPADSLLTLDVPAYWYASQGNTIIREGEPMVQVIPLKLDTRIEKALTRPFGEDGLRSYENVTRRTKVNRSWYRVNEWEGKGTRVVSQ